jgi:exodeoxyribonuclease VII small subunit
MNKKNTTTTPFNFEKAMEELEGIVQQMESGDFELEESIKQFERGVALTKQCQKALSKAEQTVLKLSSHTDVSSELVDFDTTNPDHTNE